MSDFGQNYFDIKVGQLPMEIANALKRNGMTDKEIKAMIDELPLPAGSWEPEAAAKSGNYLDSGSRTAAEYGYGSPRVGDEKINMLGNFNRVLGDYFDTGLFSPRGDRDAKENMLDVFRSAVFGDESKIDEAASLLGIFEKIPKDVRKEWNKEDTVNELASAKDITALTDTLKALIQSTEALNDEMKNGIVAEIP
jgi:hypothetical protein